MNKVTSTALLGMLALANAGLDYSAVCVFLDVDPFGTFSPNNFFAGLVAIAQSLLLIILPWVASEKIAAGEKGPAACAIIGSLFVAMAGAFLRATTEAASTTTSVSGEVVSGLSIDGMAFVLIMAGIALGEAIAAFLIKSLDIRAEAEATSEAAANSLGKGGDAAADVDAAAANPTGAETEVDAEIGGDAETAADAETVGDPTAGATPNDIVDTENSASDQAKAA